jgi:hypothetical protein
MPKVNPVYDDGFWIGVSATTATPPVWTYAKLCEGVKTVNENSNEQNQQAYYLCGHGGAHNEITGMAPQYDFECDRVEGDDAQDYIASLKYTFGEARKTSFKIVEHGKQIVADATIGNIVTFGGNAIELDKLNFSILVNGIPTVTDAT